MKVTDLELEALRKFNSGKNATPLANDLAPGKYPVRVTITLEGELRKGKPGITRSRNTSGAANVVRYLLDRINDVTFMRLERDLEQIRKGEFDVKYGQSNYERRLDAVMPHREFPRAGSSTFNGQVIIEDVITDPKLNAVTSGLKLVGGE